MSRRPGKSHRKGITVVELMDMFPTEKSATEWFERIIWPQGRCCPKCGSERTREASHRKMPYWCTDCRSYFSVKTNTPMQSSKIPLRKWAIAIHLCLTSLKSVSSMKLHRDLGVSQQTAWFMMHRIRAAWAGQSDNGDLGPSGGPVEVDETYVGGLERNRHETRKLKQGRGGVGKAIVAAVRDRETGKVAAKVIPDAKGETLRPLVESITGEDATVYTDENAAYLGLDREHGTVRHSVGEWVRGQAHVNGVESFWSMLKRAHRGTFHKISPKHLQRYVNEFAGKHNVRDSDTLDQMRDTVAAFVGRSLFLRDPVAGNGLPDLAR